VAQVRDPSARHMRPGNRIAVGPAMPDPGDLMIIPVAGAVGRGPTELAAFDAALVMAGVADRNLSYLSSAMPPASSVRPVDRIGRTPGGWVSVHCVADPVCALVVAVFESATWTSASRPAYAAACA